MFGFLRRRAADAAPPLSDLPAAADADRQAGVAQALLARGDVEGALRILRAVADKHPQSPHVAEALARALSKGGRHEEAQVVARRALDLQPGAALQVFLAQELHQLGRQAEALAQLEAVLAGGHHSAAVQAAAWNGHGKVLLALGQPEEALRSFERAHALLDDAPDALANQAAALIRLGRHEAALGAVEKALARQPDHGPALVNRVSALLNLLRIDEAQGAARAGLVLHPSDARLHWNLATSHLLLGQFEPGWREHEWRWQAVDRVAQGIGRPRWDGRQDVRDRTILLYAEQGLGDSIQFLRYVPVVARQAGKVLVDVPAPLAGLAANAGWPAHCELVRPGEAVIADYECPLLSLPLLLGTVEESIPREVPYLRADPSKVARWRERLDDGTGRLKVGVAWSGNSRHVNDHNRSIPLPVFRALASTDCRFVSLQPAVRADDMPALALWPELVRVDSELRDFSDTAALIEALDLVVSVDTSVAHLAGALGRPVWVLVPYLPDWRWMLERGDSPWYPTASLYRQSEPMAWSPVLMQVKADLSMLRPPSTAENRTALGWRSQGNLHLGEGRWQEALQCYEQAVAADPRDGSCWLNLGFVQLELGQAGEARANLQRAESLLQDEGLLADAHFLMARAQRGLGQLEPAVASFERALALRPDLEPALEELTDLLSEMARHEAALRWTTRWAQAGSTQARIRAGRALFGLRRFEEALAEMDAVLERSPDHPGALLGRGTVLMELGRLDEALASFEAALRSEGESAEALSNLAAALVRLGRSEEALPHLEHVVGRWPDTRAAWQNLSSVLLDQVRVAEALATARQALVRFPGDADLRWCCAEAELLLGDYESGWDDYEARWRISWRNPADTDPADRPLWAGEPLAGKTILLYFEQGLGDAIQWLRYLPAVAEQAHRVLLDLPVRLRPLVPPLPRNVQLVERGQVLLGVDYGCPLPSLSRAFRTRLDTIPARVPYLRTDAQQVEHWRDWLGPPTGRLRVGIAWSGNSAHGNDRNRSMPLGTFQRLLRELDCEFVCVQPEIRPADREAFEAWPGLRSPGQALRDFGDTAALMQSLDLVISVDTSVAHLAGALGRPVWILLTRRPDWRWLLDRNDSPWYPTARLFRQAKAGDWDAVLQQVRQELQLLAR